MSGLGSVRAYGLGLLALAVAVSTAGYFLAGQLLNARFVQQRQLTAPRNIVAITSRKGSLELPVYIISSPRLSETSFRQNIRANRGILYRFPQARDNGWTGLGLTVAVSAAFLDSRGKVLTILDIEPCPVPTQGKACRSYEPSVVYRQVLEVKRGWFSQNEVGPGAVVSLKLPESSP